MKAKATRISEKVKAESALSPQTSNPTRVSMLDAGGAERCRLLARAELLGVE